MLRVAFAIFTVFCAVSKYNPGVTFFANSDIKRVAESHRYTNVKTLRRLTDYDVVIFKKLYQRACYIALVGSTASPKGYLYLQALFV